MKKPLRVLIIDDERLARKDLLSLLGAHDNITVVGEADDVPSAVRAIDRLNPDVIFLDIQMPGDSGFDLLEKTEVEAHVIFVTAYDEYAIRAFEVNALDYLLKPVHPDRLAKALEKLDLQEQETPTKIRRLNYDDRLFLMLGRHFKFLKVDTVLAVTAAGDYSEVLTSDGHKGLALKSMKEWETRLPARHFIRIHRSTIINMEFIDRIEEWFNYSFKVYLKGIEEPYVISRRYATRLKDRLG
ncbi:MAG: LytTR family DNA-binding domain-containing protein [Candidatus Aminicenantes bacterium]|nr:LytTR family DNA-binding domain-containing protein [Candidatus Aminicenantes bacterium]